MKSRIKKLENGGTLLSLSVLHNYILPKENLEATLRMLKILEEKHNPYRIMERLLGVTAIFAFIVTGVLFLLNINPRFIMTGKYLDISLAVGLISFSLYILLPLIASGMLKSFYAPVLQACRELTWEEDKSEYLQLYMVVMVGTPGLTVAFIIQTLIKHGIPILRHGGY